MNKNIDINRTNYETFVIDYLEGNLDAIETACFIAFLENNPDIKEEVADINDITLAPEMKEFTQKDNLKKKSIASVSGINELNYEEYFIAHYEGDLNETQERSLVEFIDVNQELNSEFELHNSLVLTPSLDIVFPDKELLMRSSTIRPIWYSSAAAILILIAAGWFLMIPKEPELRHQVALLNKILPKETTTSLSLTTSAKIEVDERQVSVIQLPENDFPYDDHKKITVAKVEPRNISGQLVNTYDFARLVDRNDEEVIVVPDNYDLVLADVSPVSKEENRSLFGKIFDKQMANIVSRFGTNNPKSNKTVDPTYVQVLDKGILVFNTLTGNEASTMKKYNRDGELTSYQIEGKEILMGRNSPAKSSQ